MEQELGFEESAWTAPLSAPGSRPVLVLIVALLTTAMSAALCAAAILTPAPAAVVPLVVIVCIGCPLLASWETPDAMARLRARRVGGRALSQLRESLAQLPDAEHPLGHDG